MSNLQFVFNPFTGTLDYVSLGGSGGGDVTGPSSSTNQAIATYNGTTGTVIQDNPTDIIQSGGAIQATAFLTDREISTDISIPSYYSWVSPNLTIELTGSLEIELDAELIIV